MSKKRRWSTIGTASIVFVAAVAGVVVWGEHVEAQSRLQSGYASLMAEQALDHTQAPDFTLTDQNGQTIQLSALKGKVVVLEFMDPECTDICPIVSQEIVDASHDLGVKTNDVEFLAVNVNQYHESQKDLQAFSNAQGLNTLSNWHFLTADTKTLKAVWKAYGIAVVPNRTGDVQHSSFMYFINKSGQETFIANPDNAKATIKQWGKGIAFFTDKLL